MKEKKNKFPQLYKVIITAPDGRFGRQILEGLDMRTALHEKRRWNDLGMVVSIHPMARTSNFTYQTIKDMGRIASSKTVPHL